jgi:hypothetical protein
MPEPRPEPAPVSVPPDNGHPDTEPADDAPAEKTGFGSAFSDGWPSPEA